MRRVLFVVVCSLLLASCRQEKEMSIPAHFAERENLPFEQIEVTRTSTSVGMIGDILLHWPLFTYDNYDFAFASVAPKFHELDILLANQESMPGGVELTLSGYPAFNSPKHIIRDLQKNGVDMLSIANNHTLDRREHGLRKVFSHLGEYNMPYVGAYSSAEDRATWRIMERNGITIGVLAYTYGTNGIPIPAGKEYLVALNDETIMKEELAALKKEVDITVLSIHWGEEYQLVPNEMQKAFANIAAEAGADIIFGHHPHVLQPYEQIGKTHVFYSLGNFYSAQQFDSTNIGGIARIEVEKVYVGGMGRAQVDAAAFFPTAVVEKQPKQFVIVPLHEAPSHAARYDEAWVERHVGVPKW